MTDNKAKRSTVMRKMKMFAVVFGSLSLLMGCSGNTDITKNENKPANEEKTVSENRPTRTDATGITLADGNIKINGAGAASDGDVVTISDEGIYEFTGTLSDGQIVVNAPDKAAVEIVLSGVNISNSKNAAIYCKKCDDLVITLTENTKNVLNDAKTYAYDDAEKKEPNAAIFSKSDMTIGGSGTLTVNANFKHGINSKDDLVIESGTINITSVADAIRGKDSITVSDGTFEINAEGDAFQTDKTLTVKNGSFDITTQGTPAEDSDSQKGFKAGSLVIIENGTFNIKTRDDAVHSDEDAKINGGTFRIETEDDGIHADRNLYINGGDINIATCYEGFEGTIIEINGGKSFINASNDAVSAAAGTPEAGEFTGRGGNPDVQAWIKGGELEAVAGGDVVDSNGNIYVTGGTLRLSAPPYPSYEGSLLCNGDVTISGGTITAVGCMGVNVYWDKQPILWFSHADELKSGTVLSVRDKNDKVVLEFTTRSDAIQSTYTTPEFKAGEAYSLYIDGKKKSEVILQEGMNALGDDGGKFTGGYSRGNMSAFY